MLRLKICSLLCVLMLCSCGVVKVPLKPQLVHDVRSIEVARIEVGNSLLIRRMNPLFFIMGSSGLVADAVVAASNASKYEQQAGPVHQMCVERFEEILMQSLSRQGFQVHSSGKRFWDYFKASQKPLRERTDGLLHIRLSQMGFWSKGVRYGYYPAVLVSAELIDPVSREVLFSNRFSMGIDVASMKVMALAHGEINVQFENQRGAAYQDFESLLNQPKKSRDDLLRVMAGAAQQISEGLRRPKTSVMPMSGSGLIKYMPGMPLSDQEEGRFF